MGGLTYGKEEKLKQKKDIDALFAKGRWHTSGRLRIIVGKSEADTGKIGVSVSKKFFKKASDRNRIKRLLRESYRHNKPAYREAFGTGRHAMLFWASAEMPAGYAAVQEEFAQLCTTRASKTRPVADN